MSRADPRRGELSAALGQHVPATEPRIGVWPLEVGLPRNALLSVPETFRVDVPAPLIVMLHGAGGAPDHSIELVRSHTEQLGALLLAPASRSASWDIISDRRFGSDVQAIDLALAQLFAAYAVDPERLAIAGFSDGASYALSLGLANGHLFSHVLAFSPGFMAPTRQQGRPTIFISHGTHDRVLPIEQCSRRIVPRLQEAGLEVEYREFSGGHIVPEELARTAFGLLSKPTNTNSTS